MKTAAIATILSFIVALSAGPAAARGNGHAYGHVKYRHLQTVTLPDSQISYALHHQQQMVTQLRNIHRIDFSKVRIVRLTPRQKARFHVANAAMPQAMAYEPAFGLAQLDAGTQVASNSPLINQIQQILTGILVQGALGGVLGGNTNNGNNGYCGTDQYGNPMPCNNGNNGYCGADQYGNPVPCNNGGNNGYCGTDQYGNPVPCNNGGNNGYCGTDQYGNPVPCNNNGGYGNAGGIGSLANILLSSGIPLSSLIGILFSGGGVLNAIVG